MDSITFNSIILSWIKSKENQKYLRITPDFERKGEKLRKEKAETERIYVYQREKTYIKQLLTNSPIIFNNR